MSPLWMVAMVGTVLLPAGTLALGLVSLRLLRAQRVITQYEKQLAQLQEGTALLTETMELGFRHLADEIERLGGTPAAASAFASIAPAVTAAAAVTAASLTRTPAAPVSSPARTSAQAPSRPASARGTSARVSAASAAGRSVREIAADEQVSEGEVRLHLALVEAAGQWTGTRDTHAALRA